MAAPERRDQPENAARAGVAAQLKHHYGMTLEQWDALIAQQNGACAICGHVPDGSRGKHDRRLHVDHCHSAGAVRGLLCHQCNVLIGYAQECPERLAKAASYLQSPSSHRR